MEAISTDYQRKTFKLLIQYDDMIHMHKTQKNNQIQQSAIHEQGQATKFDIECVHWIHIQYRCIIFLDRIGILVYI